ncbi:MAG: 4-(cytidine 5'-diphospho)-2-C-methyl-D-erythritol kinase [Spirochaetaceae bacterium]|jgi:4-diphosphocytidyl-2-C-methyl-D-erythritol kinase|nr:4-(cytidine 5'-diphospho)-2-C-methyl-D-erythritol kinase [Spirochaetaceae bacterium]
MKIAAPCKINLHLEVRDLRSDGYHALESLFVTLGFGDDLLFTPADRAGDCAVSMDWSFLQESGRYPRAAPALPLEKNSVYQAVSLFKRRVGFSPSPRFSSFSTGVAVAVKKRIPAGSGLGGGSSDAASALTAMNLLSGQRAGQKEMEEMALELGSDVPFFLLGGGAAWVSGRGERISPVAFPRDISVLLVCPNFPSDTGAAFRLVDKDRTARPVPPRRDTESLIRGIACHPRTWNYENDFLGAFLHAPDYPHAASYRAALSALAGAGADFAGLSGSGSSCFGVFTDTKAAFEAEEALTRQKWAAWLTFPLARFSHRVLEYD